jgi:acyl carrier protein
VPDIQARLAVCFSAVFPELSQEQVESATPASVAQWDSVATVTLFALVEEEFGIVIDVDELASNISFPAICALLRARLDRPA